MIERFYVGKTIYVPVTFSNTQNVMRGYILELADGGFWFTFQGQHDTRIFCEYAGHGKVFFWSKDAAQQSLVKTV